MTDTWLAKQGCLRLLIRIVKDNMPRPVKRKRGKYLLLVVMAAGLVAAYVFHGLLFEKALRLALEAWGEAVGLVVEVGEIKARLGSPLVFEKVRVRAKNPDLSRTAAKLERVEIVLNWPTAMFGKSGRLLREASVVDGWIVMDQRREALPTGQPMRRLTDTARKQEADYVLWALPKRLVLAGMGYDIIWEGGSFGIREVHADFDEAALGRFTAAGMELRLEDVRQVFAAQHATTAWKNGEAFLADLTIRKGMTVDNLSVQLSRPGGVGVDVHAALFGGSLRGGAFFGEWRGEPGVDAAVWASGFDFTEASEFFGFDGKASGLLTEGRFTFRGNPNRPLDAEASLRVMAEDFRWGERGWKTLESSISLINRRLSLGELQLRQKENSVSANGELALSGDWKDVASTPFLFNVSASIHDMAALGELLGPPFDELSGRMTVSAVLNGRANMVGGFLSVEASKMAVRGRSVESGKLDVLFAGGEARVQRLELWSSGDYVTGAGAVALRFPNTYHGQFQGRAKDLGEYAWLPENPLPVTSGGLQFRWTGDGTRNAHSGAFQVALDDLISEWTPEGMTGRFSGTYSPRNIYFSGLELEKDKTSVVMRATLADSGIRLDDVEILQGKKQRAAGELFLPLNPFDMMAGKKLSEVVLPATALHARMQTVGDLDLAELFLSFGQKSPILGFLRGEVLASGKPDALVIKADVKGRGLRPTNGTAPVSELNLTIDAMDGVAKASGTLLPKGQPPIMITLTAPLGLTTGPDGLPRLMDPNGKLAGKIDIPPTDLTLLRPFLPDLQSVTGSISAQIDIAGTVTSPDLQGSLFLQNGRIEVAGAVPPIDHLEASIRFANQGLQIQYFTGDVGAGPFQIHGGISLADFQNPVFDLTLEGSKVLWHRRADYSLRGDISLTAKGSRDGGRVEGSLGIVDGRFFRRLEITPLIAPSPADSARPFTAPKFSGMVPAPFDAWTLQVSIKNAAPFQIIGNIAASEIQPDLVVTGTLGNPWPVGHVSLSGARAFLPSTTMEIRESRIDFAEANPWMPILDVRGFAEALDYDIRLHATGPLSEGNLTLRSDPPLSQEAIILLLTTGIAPRFHAGAGFGEAAVGQSGILLLRTLLRQFDIQGVDTESLLNRLQVSAVPPQLPTNAAGLRARLKIWRGPSVMTEQDDPGFENIGATYRFRFR